MASRLITRYGTKPVMIVGGLLSAAGLLLVSQADVQSSYATSLLPGFALFGLGLIGTLTAGQISAVADVGPQEAATAGGVISTGRQVGCVVGLAVASTAAGHHLSHLTATGATALTAATGGFERGLQTATAFAVLSALAALLAAKEQTRVAVAETAG